jgi:predicted  nucleic acid-binding Zn-ribbon protein
MSLEFLRVSKRIDALIERLDGLDTKLAELMARVDAQAAMASDIKTDVLKEVQSSVVAAVNARVEAAKTELKAASSSHKKEVVEHI